MFEIIKKIARAFIIQSDKCRSFDYHRLTVIDKIKLCKHNQRDIIEFLNNKTYARVTID